MHPAGSVIAFTTASGAGYGLLFWLGAMWLTGGVPVHGSVPLVTLVVGTSLVTVGLISSTLHLGHPERAWRAFSQWRSSWLSREGVAALFTYVPIVLCLAAVLSGSDSALDQASTLLGGLLAVGSGATVYCTGMIYASLKSIARWHNPLVVPIYLLFAAMSGAILLWVILLVFGVAPAWLAWLCGAMTLLTWGVKWSYWRSTDAAPIAGTINSATGLGGEVHAFDPPHTEDNYLLKEMGFRVARKHASKLRMSAIIFGLVTPIVFIVAGTALSAPWAIVATMIAAIAVMLGVVIERWLFFAEAQHAMSHYYGH